MIANATLALVYPTLLTVMSKHNFTVFPDEDGGLHLFELNYNPLNIKQLDLLYTNVNSIQFTLYTRKNPRNGQSIKIEDISTVQKSNWNSKKQTIFITHGWNSAGSKPACTLIRDAYLKVMDVNVIIIDWNRIADDIVYPTSAKSVPAVAEHVAKFITFLHRNANLQTASITIIGHSLGAHVAGLAARAVAKFGQVRQVIALDPAKPMFENNGPGARVDRTDAQNVQAIHTCAGYLGLDYSIGTSDFYANGGKSQPGCGNDLVGICSHARSYHYYSESITNPKGFVGISRDGKGKAYMGGTYTDPNAKGSYDIKTNSQPPYAMGG